MNKKEILARVRDKNEITLPKEIRKALKIEIGDFLKFDVKNELAIVKKGKII